MTKRQVRKYTLDFKQSSAKLAIELDQSITQTAKDLGIRPTTLHGWISKLYPNRNSSKADKLNPEVELKQLRKQVLRLTQERDILKKAAAYFASEM